MTSEKTMETRTFCGGCIFKKVSKSGKQTGCKLGRIKTFHELGVKIEEDKETRASIIYRFCSACRNRAWADKNPDPIAAVNAEMEVQVDFIVEADHNEEYETVSNNIRFTISECLNQTIKPKSVVVVTNNPHVEKNMKHFVYEVVEPMFKDSGVKFAVVRAMTKDAKDWELIDEGFPRCRHMYYIPILAMDMPLPNDIVEKINKAINEKLWPVLMITNNSKTNYPAVYMKNVHKLLSGNIGSSLHSKIEELAKEQENVHAIHYWSELCPTN